MAFCFIAVIKMQMTKLSSLFDNKLSVQKSVDLW